MLLRCPQCGVAARAPKPGSYRCPKCNATIVIDHPSDVVRFIDRRAKRRRIRYFVTTILGLFLIATGATVFYLFPAASPAPVSDFLTRKKVEHILGKRLTFEDWKVVRWYPLRNITIHFVTELSDQIACPVCGFSAKRKDNTYECPDCRAHFLVSKPVMDMDDLALEDRERIPPHMQIKLSEYDVYVDAHFVKANQLHILSTYTGQYLIMYLDDEFCAVDVRIGDVDSVLNSKTQRFYFWLRDSGKLELVETSTTLDDVYRTGWMPREFRLYQTIMRQIGKHFAN